MVAIVVSTIILIGYTFIVDTYVELWANSISYDLWWLSTAFDCIGLTLTVLNVVFWLRRSGLLFEKDPAVLEYRDGGEYCLGYIGFKFMIVHLALSLTWAAIFFESSGLSNVSLHDLGLLCLNAWLNTVQFLADHQNWRPDEYTRTNSVIVGTMLLNLLWSPTYWLLAASSNKEYLRVKNSRHMQKALTRRW